MKVTVIGCGRWGSFLAWYLDKIGHSVTLYGRDSSKRFAELRDTGCNGVVALPERVTLSSELACVSDADTVIISVDSQGLRALFEELSARSLCNKDFVLCMKGIEISTGKRLSEVASEFVTGNGSVSVWLGPGHVQEFYAGIPNCMVIDGNNEDVKKKLVSEFSSDIIRLYYGCDLVGNEVGAAAKNVIGIAAGMLDGRKMSSLKGALMARGAREVSRLIKAMGGNELSAYGLCHLGDYEATVFSKFSHNRMYGETFITGGKCDVLAEGFYTVKALMVLEEKYGVELPICRTIYSIIYENKDPMKALGKLFERRLTTEFY